MSESNDLFIGTPKGASKSLLPKLLPLKGIKTVGKTEITEEDIKKYSNQSKYSPKVLIIDYFESL